MEGTRQGIFYFCEFVQRSAAMLDRKEVLMDLEHVYYY